MDSYTLLQVSEAVGVVVVGLSSAWFSRKAAKLSEPTGNGFSALVIADLKEIKERLARLEERNDDVPRRRISR